MHTTYYPALSFNNGTSVITPHAANREEPKAALDPAHDVVRNLIEGISTDQALGRFTHEVAQKKWVELGNIYSTCATDLAQFWSVIETLAADHIHWNPTVAPTWNAVRHAKGTDMVSSTKLLGHDLGVKGSAWWADKKITTTPGTASSAYAIGETSSTTPKALSTNVTPSNDGRALHDDAVKNTMAEVKRAQLLFRLMALTPGTASVPQGKVMAAASQNNEANPLGAYMDSNSKDYSLRA